VIHGFDDYTEPLTDRDRYLVDRAAAWLNATPAGPGYAITNGELAEHIGLRSGIKSAAKVRAIIHAIRVEGAVKWLVASSKGYYRAQTAGEVRAFVESLRERGRSMTEVADALREQLVEAGQGVLI